MQEIEDEKIEFYEGSDTTFTLNGKQIVIPANLDTFNYYRSKYRRLAKVCADEFVERYIAKFIINAKKDGLNIICQCEYGESRSSGCAAAILEYFYKTGISVFADYRYYPNQVVYHKVYDALIKIEKNNC